MKDILWKGIIEDLFREFLYYFYGKWAKKNVDFEKGFQFLDNELHAIYPERASKRIVDKLVKVYLKNGNEQWFLIHVEVQDYEDETFPERMFQCYYRILDKYKKDVISLALLTDNNPTYHPKKYVKKTHKTQLVFRFDTFKLLEKSEELLNIEGNIFSIVMLAAKKAMQKNQDDRTIMNWKLALIKLLLEKGYEKEKARWVLIFVDNIANFASKESVREYERQKSELLKIEKNMGIAEAVIEYYKKLSFEKGMEKGKLEGKLEGKIEGKLEGKLEGERLKAMRTAENCLKRGFSIEDTAAITELDLEVVREIAQKMKNS